MSHEQALELAGLYALDALTPDERAAVDAHIASCTRDHSEFATLGGLAPALAAVADPLDAPGSLKDNILAAYRADVAPKAVPATAPAPTPLTQPVVATTTRPRRWQAPTWMGWAAAAVAIVLLAVVSVYGLNLRQQADQARTRADQLAAAVAAMTAPGSEVAILHGSGAASGVSGFVAFPTSTTGQGYMVVTDVPPLPTDKTYQAWYITDGTPTSAGTMTADASGSIVVSGLEPLDGAQVVAVTVEPDGGSDQPTSDPIIVGTVTTPT
jgi:anti-sigma-K factor RskA